MGRVILHIDLDAFFASCEEAKDPSLKGKPVIIGADPKGGSGRGVVSTANYEARKFGVGSALPISKAYKLCPHGVYLRGDFVFYKQVSQNIFTFISKLGYPYEQAGIDEAYVDLSSLSFDDAANIARRIQAFVKETERITCSIGIGPNKMIAKIGSDFKKPDGLTVVRAEGLKAFLDPLPIQKVPGIGPKSVDHLHAEGMHVVADIAQFPENELIERFGNRRGSWLHRISQGKDTRSVGLFREKKSIGAERTFFSNVHDMQTVFERVHELIDKVFMDMTQKEFVSQTVVVKIRYEDFETHTVQKTAFQYFTSVREIQAITRYLLIPFLKPDRKIRLVGVRFTRLEKKVVTQKQTVLTDILVSHRPHALISIGSG